MGFSMIQFKGRFGVGVDVEHNDGNCYVCSDDEGVFMAHFVGLIIRIPFLTVYVGEFFEVCEDEDE